MATATVSTKLEVSEEFKQYVETKIQKFIRDNFVGSFTFEFAFRRFQRVWAHKYIKDKYNLPTRTIGLTGTKKIEAYKPNFKCLNCNVVFNAALMEILKEANNFLMFPPVDEYHNASHAPDYNVLVETETLEYARSIMAAFHINPTVIEWRKQLPIWDHRENIMEHIMANQVTIIRGGPGVGKSTQVAQYILEYVASCAQECKIVNVIPHRIVAINLAKRVAFERGEYVGNSVGYRVATGYEHLTHTPLVFCTSEIMLRTLVNGDYYFATGTHVVVDNIDVRDKHTDLVLLCLRECLITYPKLRLVLISGSVDNQLFVDYFNGAPVINISSPNENPNRIIEYYLGDLYRIARRKPRQLDLIRLLPECPILKRFLKCFYEVVKYDSIDMELVSDLLLHICQNKPFGSILVYLPTYEDIKELQQVICTRREFKDIDYDLYFLHRMVDISDQISIFQTNTFTRKIILGTVLAESSHFIDDIYYVIDIGKIREAQFVSGSRLSNVTMSWISQAAAIRRSTRMGRNDHGPVECYRVYTEQEFERMAPLDTAEMLKAPITDLCLISRKIAPNTISLKAFLNRSIQPPPEVAIDCSISYLKAIGALDADESVTAWGNVMGQLPVEPRLTKMLMFALAFNCIEPVVTIVTFISLRGPFPLPALLENQANLANCLKQYSSDANSDHLSLLKLFTSWQIAKIYGNRREFCKNHYLRGGFMDLVILKRHELLKHLHLLGYLSQSPNENIEEHNQQGNNWPVIKACLTAGLAPQVACIDRQQLKLSTKFSSNLEIGNHSVCYGEMDKFPTNFIIYEESAPNNLVKNVTCITPFTLLIFGSNCLSEIRDYDDKFKPNEDMGLCRFNSWINFSSKYSSFKEIMRMKKNIDKYIVFYITLDEFFPGSDADKTFNIINNALKVEELGSEINLFIMNVGDKPINTPIRVNYSTQDSDRQGLEIVESPDDFYFAPVLSEYRRYISPALSENPNSSFVATVEDGNSLLESESLLEDAESFEENATEDDQLSESYVQDVRLLFESFRDD